MSFPRILLPRLILIFGCAFVLAGIGLTFQTNRLLEEPRAFRSQAKVLVDVHGIDQAIQEKDYGQSSGTTAELLETAEMNRRARERVRALNPEIQECVVTIGVAHPRGSSSIHIRAFGEEPKYTRIFLDALLDEFIAFRRDGRENEHGPELQKVLEEAATLQKEMKESEAALEKAHASAGSISANVDHVRLLARLNAQRNERDSRRVTINAMAENDAGRVLLQTRLSAIEQEIQHIETQLQRQDAAASELRVLTEKFGVVKQAYDKKSGEVRELQTSIDTDPDSVAVTERATPAAEIVGDWLMPIALGAGGGALLGGLIGLMLSQLLLRSPKLVQMPTAIG